MDFIDDEDLELVARGTVTDIIAQLAYIIDPTGRGRIDFQHIHAISGGDLAASGTLAAGLARFAFVAVERLCENSRGRSLSTAARPGEQESMGDAPGLEGVQQSPGDVLLPYELMKVLGSPLAGQDLVLHRGGCWPQPKSL